MPIDITFFHTAEVHVTTFETLIKQYAPNLAVKHVVNEAVLEKAIKSGLTNSLKSDVSSQLIKASEESIAVVCTCSTLGEIAENTQLNSGNYAKRIDRAMADVAVTTAKTILVLAALESTLAPTKALLETSQRFKGTSNQIEYSLVEGSWEYFLAGNKEAYLLAIKDVIEAKQSLYDCIVLAQASMADATKYLIDKRALILSSPELGVQALVNDLVHQTV